MSKEAVKDGAQGAAAASGEPELLDHNYDGIQEYDNPLPGWWSFLLWICFLFSPFYAVWVHGGENSVMAEYTSDVSDVARQKAEEAARNPVSNESLVDFSKDPSSVQAGAAIFSAKCVSCHEQGGAGKIGPNLTDDFWVNGDGTPMAIYKVIAEGGRPGKGMQAWGKKLAEMEVRQVSAFVLTLHGTTPPNPKAPEGTKVE